MADEVLFQVMGRQHLMMVMMKTPTCNFTLFISH